MRNISHMIYGLLGALALAIVTAGIFYALRAESNKPYSIPILMYHEVGEATGSAWCVPVETFRSQMIALREQGYQTVLPSDIAARRKWGKPLPRKPVIISFDDGYLGNLTIIEPILRENGLRAIVFLITAQIAGTEAERLEYEGKKCLVWPEVLEMQKRRTFVFGGHSHTHANLAASGDPLPDILECRRQLELHGIREPYAFCYPFGQHKEKTQLAVKAAKFRTAFVCEDAVATIGPATNLFALPRVSVMGGRHDFTLLAGDIDSKANLLVCRIRHTGIPLEISARLRTNGNTEIWLPKQLVAQGEFELRFTLQNPDRAVEGAALEIWDKHRLFKLAVFNR